MPPSAAVALVPEVGSDELNALVNVLGVKDHTPAELTLFALTAKRLGLDPFAKQIYSIKRKDNNTGTYRQSIQVSIDGFRSIADRTGQYAGQDEPTYGPNLDGHPEFATVRVLKLIGGQIVGTAATAYWKEYAVTGPAGRMWERMPHVMLAKCAEAQALRKAFPTQLSGVYTEDEMGQSDRPTAQRTDVDRETGEVLRPRPVAALPAPVAPQGPSQAEIAALRAQFQEDAEEAAMGDDSGPYDLSDIGNGGIAPTGGMTSAELFRAAEEADIPKAHLTMAAKRLFGDSRWKVTELSDEERADLWAEVSGAA